MPLLKLRTLLQELKLKIKECSDGYPHSLKTMYPGELLNPHPGGANRSKLNTSLNSRYTRSYLNVSIHTGWRYLNTSFSSG